MNTSLQTPEKQTTLTPVVPVGDELMLSAATPLEMRESQAALVLWAERKIADTIVDRDDLKQAVDHAVKRKWKTATLRAHLRKADQRVMFYTKVRDALRAGYIIVPGFPVTMFAIRTEKGKPKAMVTIDPAYSNGSLKSQSAELLATGEGEYVNPFPVVHQQKNEHRDPNNPANVKTTYTRWAEQWDQFEFPVSMAKPQIMELTDRAMSLKIFDELGVLPAHKREPDPIVVGRIIYPGEPSWRLGSSKRAVTFIVAWHLDTRTI